MNPKHFFTAILIFATFCFFACPINAQTGTDSLSKPLLVKLPELRLGTHIGYGYKFARIPNNHSPEIQKYFSKLQHNLCFGTDISHFYSKYMGFGFKYNALHTQVASDEHLRIPDGDNFMHASSEKRWIHNISVFLAGRYFIVPNKHYLFANVGIGYVRYQSKIDFYSGRANSKLTDNNAALLAEIGYDFFVIKSLAIGLQVSTYIGLLKYLNKEELLEHYKVTHIDITLGFRFYK
jgi:hypothetical protein